MTQISSRTYMQDRELEFRQDEVALNIDVNEEKRDFNAEETLPPD